MWASPRRVRAATEVLVFMQAASSPRGNSYQSVSMAGGIQRLICWTLHRRSCQVRAFDLSYFSLKSKASWDQWGAEWKTQAGKYNSENKKTLLKNFTHSVTNEYSLLESMFSFLMSTFNSLTNRYKEKTQNCVRETTTESSMCSNTPTISARLSTPLSSLFISF